jgi:heavy metal sensor kinase
VRPWWQQRTLRFRLALWYGIGGTLLLAAFSATIYLFVSARLARPLDHQLRRDLALIRQHLSVDASGRVLWRGEEIAPSQWASANPWFELWNAEGQLVERVWPFSDRQLERLPVAPARGRETISVFALSPDVRLRVLSVPLSVSEGDEEWMVRVMCIHEPAMNALRALLFVLVVCLPVVVILLVVGGYAITRRWLKPLDRMVAEAQLITADDLSRRLPVPNPQDELGRLATVFNNTLARLEDSFRTLDRFVSDAAHELLTPLTTLRSVGEVTLRARRSPAEYHEAIGSMLEEAQRLQLLVEKLLQLARAEGGANIVERQQVYLDELLRDCAEDARVLAEERDQTITVTARACELETDPLLLRQAVQNLLDNAIKYSQPGALIEATAGSNGGRCEIAISDNGPGIPPEFHAVITDRFFRLRGSLGRGAGGAGLGLAITKAYVGILGGELTYSQRPGGGSIFRLSLPRHISTQHEVPTASADEVTAAPRNTP